MGRLSGDFLAPPVLQSASLLLGIRGKALDVESSTGKAGSCSHVEICVGPRSVSGPDDICVRARRSLCRSRPGALCRAPALCVGPGALCIGHHNALCVGPGALCFAPGALCVATHSAAPNATGPQLRSVCHPSSPTRSLFPRREPQTLLLGGKFVGKIPYGCIFTTDKAESYTILSIYPAR